MIRVNVRVRVHVHVHVHVAPHPVGSPDVCTPYSTKVYCVLPTLYFYFLLLLLYSVLYLFSLHSPRGGWARLCGYQPIPYSVPLYSLLPPPSLLPTASPLLLIRPPLTEVKVRE